MKMTTRDKKLLLCVGGVILGLLSYLLVFRGMSAKNEELMTQNQSLAEQVRNLETLEANQAKYAKDTEYFEEEIADVIDSFPGEVREETAIMYAYTLETEADVHFNSMAITPANLLYTMGQGVQNTAAADGTAAAATTPTAGATPTEAAASADGTVAAPSSTVSQEDLYYLSVVSLEMSYSVSYNGFKDVIDFIQAGVWTNGNVESIALSYDSETGNLIGTMTLNLFSLSGPDKEYVAPYIPSMPEGNTNPFGTLQ